jgi:hypothetical protein
MVPQTVASSSYVHFFRCEPVGACVRLSMPMAAVSRFEVTLQTKHRHSESQAVAPQASVQLVARRTGWILVETSWSCSSSAGPRQRRDQLLTKHAAFTVEELTRGSANAFTHVELSTRAWLAPRVREGVRLALTSRSTTPLALHERTVGFTARSEQLGRDLTALAELNGRVDAEV